MSAVFLDRDGVLTRLCLERGPRETARTADEVELLPGSADAVRIFRQAGVRVIVATNQPNIAKGKATPEAGVAIERRITELLGPEAALDATYTCFHHPGASPMVVPELCRSCQCRKPAPGLLLQAAQDLSIDLSRSVLVGDHESDIEAGRRAGCWTVRLVTAWSPLEPAEPPADATARDLLDAVPAVLQFLGCGSLRSFIPHVRHHENLH